MPSSRKRPAISTMAPRPTANQSSCVVGHPEAGRRRASVPSRSCGSRLSIDDADAADRRHARQQQLVAAVAEQAQRHVRAEHQADVADRDPQRPRVEACRSARCGSRAKPSGTRIDERQEEPQLQPDAGRRCISAPGASGRDRSSARRRSESATGRSMRWPLTYVPLVLPWSSMNQLRPRKVSIAWRRRSRSRRR